MDSESKVIMGLRQEGEGCSAPESVVVQQLLAENQWLRQQLHASVKLFGGQVERLRRNVMVCRSIQSKN